jgi:hypothetical protein
MSIKLPRPYIDTDRLCCVALVMAALLLMSAAWMALGW